MNTINNYSNNQSFKSIYKFNEEKNCTIETKEAIAELINKASFDSKCECFSDFATYNEMIETGITNKIHISAPDEYDNYIESFLNQNNIVFQKQSIEEALKLENIYGRIVLEKPKDGKLISLDTQTVDNLLKLTPAFYISKNGETGAIGNRYQNFIKYLKTGRQINASKLELFEENGRLKANIKDGRHRYTVMRDIGLDKIKFALDEYSYNLAIKYGLVNPVKM